MGAKIFFILSLFCLTKAYAQQEGQFSQYIFNTVYVNPAYAGYKEDIYLQSFYRSQWTGLNGAPKSLSLAIDGATRNNKVGLSLLLSSDKIGVQTSRSVFAGYAYRLSLNQQETSKLAFGMSIGFMQTGLEGNLLIADESGDSYVPHSNQSSLLPNARAGILFTTDIFFAGFSVNNILITSLSKKDTETLQIIPKPHLYFIAGSILPAGEDMKIKSTILLKDDLGGPTNLDINGFLLLKEKVWIGAMYRTSVKLYNKNHLQKELLTGSAIGIMAELFAKNDIRIGYSFDYSLNKLRTYNNGTHEISLGFYLSGNKRAGSYGCYF
jgi:type IX secretion system PorP/SprF family membrane protein